ncbi:MAG: tRNA uridine-5-carboxymethylaminomethyl(34) synthesis GTPase MnmE [Oscillospiraceae bacterium]
MSDTIAAVATGNVRSAIGIVRLSGDGAIEAADKIFRAKNGRPLLSAPAGRLIYGGAYNHDGELLDMCLCTVSRAPMSYTGENTAEFQCHGSPVVLSAILSALFHCGVRQALPGEFTKRAFLNGKLDLTGAEAVIDLIDSETEEAAKNASGQLSGAVVRRTDRVYSELLDIVSHFQAVVDYPDEDIDEFEADEYIEELKRAEGTLRSLLDTFERGRFLRDGVPCAIIGRPNVGKSSLLNALVGFDRAIVTDIAGTTRDTVEEKCVLGGSLLRLIDTAGMRETGDAVERIGVLRAKKAAEEAGLILVLTDASEALKEEDAEAMRIARDSGKPWILLPNKMDKAGCRLPEAADGKEAARIIPISAKTGEGIGLLADAVKELFSQKPVPQGEILTNARQAGEVSRAADSLRGAREAIASGVTPDAVLTLVEEALSALGALSGKNLREDVVDRIFQRFCVGK